MTVDPSTETATRDGCCVACNGRGGTPEGRCWDCYGTGHAHAPDPTCGVPTAEERDDEPF